MGRTSLSVKKQSKIGIIQQQKIEIENKTHVVASMQTLCSHSHMYKTEFDSFGMVIFDEAHIGGAEMLSSTLGTTGCKYGIG